MSQLTLVYLFVCLFLCLFLSFFDINFLQTWYDQRQAARFYRQLAVFTSTGCLVRVCKDGRHPRLSRHVCRARFSFHPLPLPFPLPRPPRQGALGLVPKLAAALQPRRQGGSLDPGGAGGGGAGEHHDDGGDGEGLREAVVLTARHLSCKYDTCL